MPGKNEPTPMQPPESSPPAVGRQWAAVLLAPSAFLVNLLVQYSLTRWACGTGHHIVLHVVDLVALGIAAFGAWVGWSEWQAAGAEWPHGAGPAVPRGRWRPAEPEFAGFRRAIGIPRSRFMAVGGALLSSLFCLLIIAQGIAAFVVGPCQR